MGIKMVNRDDMLELTRRMTPARASIDRIAGAYFDEEGYVDGTFNTHFLKLSASDGGKNLELAKAVLISKTNEQLKEYRIPDESRRPGSIWQLFEGIKETGFLYPAFKDHSTDWSSSHSTIDTVCLCLGFSEDVLRLLVLQNVQHVFLTFENLHDLL